MNHCRNFFKLISVSGLSLALVSCASTPVKFPQVTTERIDTSKGRDVSASASGFQFLLLIPIVVNNRQARAYEALKAQAGNDVLTDIQIEESWGYGFVGTSYTTTLTAKAYPLKP